MSDQTPSMGFMQSKLWHVIAGYAAALDSFDAVAMYANIAAIERLIAERIREERIKMAEECWDAACSPRPAIERLIAAERAKGEA